MTEIIENFDYMTLYEVPESIKEEDVDDLDKFKSCKMLIPNDFENTTQVLRIKSGDVQKICLPEVPEPYLLERYILIIQNITRSTLKYAKLKRDYRYNCESANKVKESSPFNKLFLGRIAEKLKSQIEILPDQDLFLINWENESVDLKIKIVSCLGIKSFVNSVYPNKCKQFDITKLKIVLKYGDVIRYRPVEISDTVQVLENIPLKEMTCFYCFDPIKTKLQTRQSLFDQLQKTEKEWNSTTGTKFIKEMIEVKESKYIECTRKQFGPHHIHSFCYKNTDSVFNCECREPNLPMNEDPREVTRDYVEDMLSTYQTLIGLKRGRTNVEEDIYKLKKKLSKRPNSEYPYIREELPESEFLQELFELTYY